MISLKNCENTSSLRETFLQFNEATQYVADISWRIKQETGYVEKNKTKLHNITYQDLRNKLDLNAQHIQQARNLAADALQGCVESMKNGKKTSKPEFSPTIVIYDGRTITYYKII